MKALLVKWITKFVYLCPLVFTHSLLLSWWWAQWPKLSPWGVFLILLLTFSPWFFQHQRHTKVEKTCNDTKLLKVVFCSLFLLPFYWSFVIVFLGSLLKGSIFSGSMWFCAQVISVHLLHSSMCFSYLKGNLWPENGWGSHFRVTGSRGQEKHQDNPLRQCPSAG